MTLILAGELARRASALGVLDAAGGVYHDGTASYAFHGGVTSIDKPLSDGEICARFQLGEVYRWHALPTERRSDFDFPGRVRSVTQEPAPYSAARLVGELLYVSGQLGRDKRGIYGSGIATQTELALASLDTILETHRASRTDVIKCQVFLSTMDDWSAMNHVYRDYFAEPYPARSAIGVDLAPGALVEIEAVVHVRS